MGQKLADELKPLFDRGFERAQKIAHIPDEYNTVEARLCILKDVAEELGDAPECEWLVTNGLQLVRVHIAWVLEQHDE